jgi:alkylation response protein AidB-like acyl-CoA dehydrogenase
VTAFAFFGAEPTMGLRGSLAYNLELNDVTVSDTYRLSEVGGGFVLAIRTLDRTLASARNCPRRITPATLSSAYSC